MLCGPLVKRWERPRHSAVCKARSYRSCCRSRLIPIRWLILIGGASIRRSAHNTYGAPTGGCCSLDLLAVLARIALEVAVFVAPDETASTTLPNAHTKAASPAAPADRRHTIRRVDLLAVLARGSRLKSPSSSHPMKPHPQPCRTPTRRRQHRLLLQIGATRSDGLICSHWSRGLRLRSPSSSHPRKP